MKSTNGQPSAKLIFRACADNALRRVIFTPRCITQRTPPTSKKSTGEWVNSVLLGLALL